MYVKSSDDVLGSLADAGSKFRLRIVLPVPSVEQLCR